MGEYSIWENWVANLTGNLKASSRWRQIRSISHNGSDSPVIFASNDYLGLTSHPTVKNSAISAIEKYGAGSGASRLVTGTLDIHIELEKRLALWKSSQSALAFSSGYSANVGVLSALGGEDAFIISDELNHASLIDGCRLSRTDFRVAKHCDLGDYERLLTENREKRLMVVTDSVFSMDGDIAPLEELAKLCASFGALLIADEAHAVMGPYFDLDGEGKYCGAKVVRIGTFSKTFGSLGGFVATTGEICDLLVNRARSFIFSTALSPGDAGGALGGLSVIQSEEGERLVGNLRKNVEIVAPHLGLKSNHPSPILPLIVGEESLAIEASKFFLDRGLLITAIRPPTVAPMTSR
ncbi:MAG: 8-amino-7-oxononanoate synthase, partial [Acidimicrobiales bacterium]|nr:8-amino-7-oxononanoate synthase [Acidimicrobiales bacterium]